METLVLPKSIVLSAARDARHEAGDAGALRASQVDLARELLEQLTPAERRGDDPLRHAPLEVLEAWADEVAELARWPLGRSCSTHYRARRTSGARRLSAIELGVVHCTQGGPFARPSASWFANNASQGSAHVVADALECYRTLPPSAIAWGAPGVNGNGWHLELAGMAQWSRAEWLRHRGTLERGAYKLAQNGRGRFPMRMLTDAELLAVLQRRPGRKHGIVSHRQVSRVFGGTHFDPGSHFPWDVFMGYARKFERELR